MLMKPFLFEEFIGEDNQKWEGAAEKFLKGAALDTLDYHSKDDWSAKAIYHQFKEEGQYKSSRKDKNLGAYISLSNPRANQQVLGVLNNGAEMLHCFNYSSHEALKNALKDVDLSLVRVRVYLLEIPSDFKLVDGVSFVLDPFISSFLEGNSVEVPSLPAGVSIGLFGNVLRERGASEIQELTYLLWALDQLEVQDLDTIYFLSGIGRDFLNELAKFRTIPVLIQNYNEASNTRVFVDIQAVNALVSWSTWDEESNLLRACAQIMSAYMSNIDGVIGMPYNILSKSDDLSAQRWAQNMIWLLRKESFMDEVMDPAKGSYYIENIGKQMLSLTWKALGDISETEVKEQIAAQLNAIVLHHQKQKNSIESGDEMLIGVNQFPATQKEASTFQIFEGIKDLYTYRWAYAFEKGGQNG